MEVEQQHPNDSVPRTLSYLITTMNMGPVEPSQRKDAYFRTIPTSSPRFKTF